MKKKLSAVMFLVAAVFGILLFAGTTSEAATAWQGSITQTQASEDSITISCDTYLGAQSYGVYFSYDNFSWQDMGEYSSSPEIKVTNLSPAKTYYAKIVAYSGNYWSSSKSILAETSSIDVVTAPSAITGLTQTGAKAKSITMKWDAASGATAYYVYRYNGYNDYTLIGSSKTNSYTASGLEASSEIRYFVVGCRQNSAGQLAVGTEFSAVYMKTAPAKVSYVSITNYWQYISEAKYTWNKVENSEGYEFQLLDYKGNVIHKTATTSSYTNYAYVQAWKKGIFTKARARAYVVVNNKKVYGAWSPYSYNASSKSISVKRSTNGKKISLKWSKIKGASGYQVYVSTKSGSGYVKVKSLGAKKTSYSFTKFKKKSLKKNTKYYIRIKYQIKSGKKKITSAIGGEGSI